MEIVILVVIIIALIVILYFTLDKIITNIKKTSDKYYFDNLQRISSKLDEKNSTSSKDNETKEKEEKEKENTIETFDSKLLKLLSECDYEDLKYYKMSKYIDENFLVNEDEILRNFIEEHKDDDKNVVYEKICDRFSINLIYKLKQKKNDEKVKMLKKMFSEEENEVLDKYLEDHKFNIKSFLLYIDHLKSENDDSIIVYTSFKGRDFKSISPRIKCEYRKDLFKGIIIKYHNSIYDYSINERDVV